MQRLTSNKNEVNNFPQGRSLSEFQPLSSKEQELLELCRTGGLGKVIKAIPYKATEENRVRANFVRFLLLGGDSSAPVCEQGVALANAWIEGELDLASSKVDSSINFLYCVFDRRPDLTDATVRGTVSFNGCTIPGIYAQRLKTSGRLSFSGSAIKGQMNLDGARIDSSLMCQGVYLAVANGCAISAIYAVVGGSARFDRSSEIFGSIDLTGADIAGSLIGDDIVIKNNDSLALSAGRIKVGGAFYFRRATFQGECQCSSARVGGGVSFRAAKLSSETQFAFVSENSIIGGDLQFSSLISNSEIRLNGSKIEGSLLLLSASISSMTDVALNAERISINGSVFLVDGFFAIGEVRWNAAYVNGNFRLTDSNIESASKVKEHHANGKKKSKKTFSAEGMIVQKAFVFCKMKKPVNYISLSSCTVGRLIDDETSWGRNINLNGFDYGSFAANAPVDWESRIRWLDKQSREHCGLENKSKNFKPQPWRHLRKVLLNMGHFEDARTVAVKYENRMRKAGLVGYSTAQVSISSVANRIISRAAHRVFGLLIGYGYRPIKLVAWMVFVWLFCGAVFWFAAIKNVMAPSNPLVFQNEGYASCKRSGPMPKDGGPLSLEDGNWYYCKDLPAEFTGFSPLAYSLDLLLPVVDLQQEKDWAPKVPTPKIGVYDEFATLTLQHFVRLVVWLEILFGWLASLLLVAVVSGLTKRSNE